VPSAHHFTEEGLSVCTCGLREVLILNLIKGRGM